MLSVNLGGLTLKNPVLPASGPLTSNVKKMKRLAEAGVGAMVTKTISFELPDVPRPCIVKTGDGLLNCELWSEDSWMRWRDEFLPEIRELDLPIIVSAGYRPADYEKVIPEIEAFADGFELSTHYVSNDPSPLYDAARSLRSMTDKPVFIKMSPHAADPVAFAKAALEGGATGIAAINSVGPCLSIDIRKNKSGLGSPDGRGWLSGPPIKPIALHFVDLLARHIDAPIIGVGGIASAEDVVEFMLAGATAVQLLSAAIIHGVDLYTNIIDDLEQLLPELGYNTVDAVMSAARSRLGK